MKDTIYECCKRLTDVNKTLKVAHCSDTEAEAIRWLEEHGGGVYRNALHRFEMEVEAISMTELNGLRIALHDELLTECIAALAIVEKRLRNDTVKLEPFEYRMLAVRLHEVQQDMGTLKMSK